MLEKGRWDGAFYIAGMRDPMAPDPVGMLEQVGLGAVDVKSKWVPFKALHPSLVLARATRMLAPPRSVAITLEGDVLVAKGTAPHAWISVARLVARSIAGISRFDTDTLQDLDLEAYNALRPQLENQIFYYLVNRRNLWPGQEKKFKQFIANVSTFSRISRRLGGGHHIEIRGHTRASGSHHR